MADVTTKLWSLMGVFALLQTFLPLPLRQWLDRSLEKLWEKIFKTTDRHVQLEVEEGVPGYSLNVLYRQVAVYLGSLRSTLEAHARLNVYRADESGSLSFCLPVNETLEDSFRGVHVWWIHTSTQKSGSSSEEQRSFTLKFLKTDRSLVLPDYLENISKVALEIERRNAQRHIYINNYRGWEEVPFNHPSTFDTLALEANLADRIKADLEAFSQGKEFYHRIGRVWKRGYLLYGPPGTGKSSLIAAIANFLHYDIYDLELTKVLDNAELKSLLMQTTRKSIIVIEDIDCTVDLKDRTATDSESTEEKNEGQQAESAAPPSNMSCRLTLSGLLNFTDGLWSCCGEERIFIFTTNHKDRLDPALLRAGRMDMHILLSYCTFSALKKMASNYLGIQQHWIYPELEDAMRAPHQITPAAMAELLISHRSDPDAALKQVIVAIRPCSTTTHENSVDNCTLANMKRKTRRGCTGTFFILGSLKSKKVV